jgi:hypothetical protein
MEWTPQDDDLREQQRDTLYKSYDAGNQQLWNPITKSYCTWSAWLEQYGEQRMREVNTEKFISDADAGVPLSAAEQCYQLRQMYRC